MTDEIRNYGTRQPPAKPTPLVVVVSAVGVLLAVASASVLYRQQRRLWRFEETTGRVVSARVERHDPEFPGRGGGEGASDRARGGATDAGWSSAADAGRSGAAAAAATGSADATDAGDVARESNEYLGPVVEYEYRAGAQRYANDTVWPAGVEPLRRRLRRGDADSPESVVERFPEGEPVAVYHDPEDASLVPARNWTIPVVCSVFVVALTVWAAHCTGVAFVPVGEFDC